MRNIRRHYILKSLKTLTRVLPALFWIALIFGFDSPSVGILTVFSALLHELGHIIAASIFSPSFSLRTSAVGFALKPLSSLSYTKELIIAAAGPLANLLIFALTLPFSKALGGYVFLFGMINLMTAISNLIPLYGYDGYRIAECIALKHRRADMPVRALEHISFTLICIMCFLSLYLMEKLNTGYWIFFILVFSLIKGIKRNRSIFFEKTREKQSFREF